MVILLSLLLEIRPQQGPGKKAIKTGAGLLALLPGLCLLGVPTLPSVAGKRAYFPNPKIGH